MTAPDEPSRIEIATKLRELLGRATLARARGQREQALKLTQEALVVDNTSPEAHELMGDLLLDLKRGAEAMESFRRARELYPDRVVLEDKIARAALLKAAKLQGIALSQAILEGRVKPPPKRSAGAAAALSLLIPGLGQLYNGELAKGLAMVAGYITLMAIAVVNVIRSLAAGAGGGVTAALTSGGAVVVSLLLLILWVYAIIDAAVQSGRKAQADETRLV